MITILDVIFHVFLILLYLFTATLVALYAAKMWCWSDKTFTRLIYWLLVGLLAFVVFPL